MPIALWSWANKKKNKKRLIDGNENDNNNNQDEVHSAIIYNKATARVHSGHLNECGSAPGGRQAANLTHESVCRLAQILEVDISIVFPTFFHLLQKITPWRWVITPLSPQTTIFFTKMPSFWLHTQLKRNKWQTIVINFNATVVIT